MEVNRRPHSAEVAPVSGVVPIERMSGDDAEDTEFLGQMLEEAKNYVRSFSWCDGIVNAYFAGGVGKIFAIFLFKINASRPDVDPWEWIFVGDIPPAYLPLEDAGSKLSAFDAYMAGMKKWVKVARQGREPKAEDCCPPVNVPANPEWAEELDKRLRLMKELIRPSFE
jgi:hypothetical protein